MKTLVNLFNKPLSKEEYYTLLFSIRPALVVASKLQSYASIAVIIGMKPSAYSMWLTHTNIASTELDPTLINTIIGEAVEHEQLH